MDSVTATEDQRREVAVFQIALSCIKHLMFQVRKGVKCTEKCLKMRRTIYPRTQNGEKKKKKSSVERGALHALNNISQTSPPLKWAAGDNNHLCVNVCMLLSDAS